MTMKIAVVALLLWTAFAQEDTITAPEIIPGFKVTEKVLDISQFGLLGKEVERPPLEFFNLSELKVASIGCRIEGLDQSLPCFLLKDYTTGPRSLLQPFSKDRAYIEINLTELAFLKDVQVEAKTLDLARTYVQTAYDGNRRPIPVFHRNKAVAETYSFDAAERLVAKTGTGLDSYGTKQYAYVASSGKVATTIDPNGYSTGYNYDQQGNLLIISDPDALTLFSYDASGKVASLEEQDGSGITTVRQDYNYDAQGRVVNIFDSQRGTAEFGFDNEGRLAHTVNFTPDPQGAVPTQYEYNDKGQVVRIETGNDSEDLTYDDENGRIVRRVIQNAFGITTQEFSYDKNGNVTLFVETRPSGERSEYAYSYDNLNRLIEIQYPDGTSEPIVYDDYGRPVGGTLPVTSFEYDSAVVTRKIVLELPQDRDVSLVTVRYGVLEPISSALGDPHFNRWTVPERDTFHGECDLVLLHKANVQEGIDLDVHVRTTIEDSYSYIESAAVKFGDDIIEFQMDTVVVNGQGVDDNEFPLTLGQGSLMISKLDPSLVKKRRFFRVEYLGHALLDVHSTKKFMGVNLSGHKDYLIGSAGILGAYGTGAMIARDGRQLDDFQDLAFEWQVNHMLGDPRTFQEAREPQLPYERCRLPSVSMESRRRKLRGLDHDLYQQAVEVCTANHIPANVQSCVDDVVLTGELDLADVVAV